MVLNANRAVLIALILGLTLGQMAKSESFANEPAVGCHKYTCKTSSQVFSTGTCASYDVNTDTYYLLKCDGSTYCASDVDDLNWTCYKNPDPAPTQNYPGEKCSKDTDCIYSQGCSVTGVCRGLDVGANCTNSEYCSPGNSCQSVDGVYVCAALIGVDKSGCASDYDCVMNAGCNINSTTVLTKNFCRAYGSYEAGSVIYSASCVSYESPLCASGYCFDIDEGVEYFCTETLKNAKAIPTPCYDTQANDCNSNIDTKTNTYLIGSCDCAYNKMGEGYCSLYNGDAPNVKFREQIAKWYNSDSIKKCNTVRRFFPISATCATNFWDSKDVATLVYYSASVSSYVTQQGAEQCVYDIFLTDYEAAKKSYDNGGDSDGGNGDGDDSAVALTASALILAMLA